VKVNDILKAKGRAVKQSDVKTGYGEGRVLNAKDALSAGLVDRIETVGEAATRLARRGSGVPETTRAEAETPEPTLAEGETPEVVAEADAGADVAQDREAVLAALAEEIDPILAARAFDKIGALANN